jgi:hypothetical protein
VECVSYADQLIREGQYREREWKFIYSVVPSKLRWFMMLELKKS